MGFVLGVWGSVVCEGVRYRSVRGWGHVWVCRCVSVVDVWALWMCG